MLKCVFGVSMCFVFSLCTLQGQSVLNSSGGTLQNATHTLEYAVGEVAITTYTNAQQALTQGVLQPKMEIIPIDKGWDDNVHLIVYPNPATSEVFIETDYATFDEITVFDKAGKAIFSRPFTTQSIDMKTLASGTYVLRITDHLHSISQSFNIIIQ